MHKGCDKVVVEMGRFFLLGLPSEACVMCIMHGISKDTGMSV